MSAVVGRAPHVIAANDIFYRCGTLMLILATLALSGCTWFQSDVRRGYSQNGSWDGSVVYTTADVRMVSQRVHPVTHQLVTCTEPTSDVAKALSTAAELNLKGGTANANGQIGAGGGSAEAVAELAGRSTALLALRDALFRACEAYANGIIGSDAYALVLSRYGQLMTTLFLGEDMQGAAHAATASVQSPPAASSTGSGTPAPASGDPSAATPPAAPKKSSDVRSATEPAPLFLRVTQQSAAAGKAVDKAATAAPKVAGGGAPKKADQTTPAAPVDASSAPPPAAPAATDTNSTGLAGGLVLLNQQYFNLDQNLTSQLVVACVNEYDPTRLRQPIAHTPALPSPPAGVVDPKNAPNETVVDEGGHNPWLRRICDHISSPENVKAQMPAAPATPAAAAPPASASPPAKAKIAIKPVGDSTPGA